MPTNYTTFQAQLLNTVGAVSSDPSWTTEFPLIIDRAEQRLYRDLDLLGTRVTDGSGFLTANSRNFALPTTLGTFLVVEQVSVVTPAGALSSNGSVNPLVRVSPAMIDLTYPSNSLYTGVPEFYAVLDNANIIVGPPPNFGYSMQVRGTQRPAPLSIGNSSTILTQMLPDLFFAAGMVEAGAFMRFTEPMVFQTWLAEYNSLLNGAQVEEFRKKAQAEGWVDKMPSPIATPPRQ